MLGTVGVASTWTVLLAVRRAWSAMSTDSLLTVEDVLDLEVFIFFVLGVLAALDVPVLATSR